MYKSNPKVVFKDYDPNQALLLPPTFDELIINNHPVRTVSSVIDALDLGGLVASYKGGGTSSHHPRMLLKVLVYGYLCNIYSSRKLEEAVQQNIHFMWLAAMSRPDHNTINRFRSERLKDQIKTVFTQVVLLLEKEGLVSLKTAFIDGTKMEACANRYTFVWGKAIKRSKQRIEKQLEELWAYTQKVASEELNAAEPIEFREIDSKKVKQTIEKIDKALKKKSIPGKVRQKINYARKNWPANLDRYEEAEKILKGRNSYSKTDKDATLMRMKEDHMRNGQLKPAYNLQLSTNNQFILNYTLHNNPSDSNTLQPHLERFKMLYGRLPGEAVADAGYGSEQNYMHLKNEGISAYVKYNHFDRNQRSRNVKQDLPYDQELDAYICPAGKPLFKCGERTRRLTSGYLQHVNIYKPANCAGCALLSNCQYKTYRKNRKLAGLQTDVEDLLKSERGVKLRKQRCWDVETVFAQIKNNKLFRRYYLRGLQKVEIETGLIAIAHNLRKKAA